MLVASILPMPSLDAARYVALYLTNPLLLAAYPDRMRATAEQWEAGGYDQNATAALAAKLHELRKHELLHTPVEARDNEGLAELFDVAMHPLFADERTRLREKLMEARPSEYDWFRAVLEAALLVRAAERDAAHLNALTPFAHRATQRQLLLDVATTASRATGVPVRLASELAA